MKNKLIFQLNRVEKDKKKAQRKTIAKVLGKGYRKNK